MKRVIMVTVAFLAVLLSVSGCFPGLGLVGSGRTSTRPFELSGFTAVQAGSAFEVTIRRGEQFSVSVTADDNVWDRVEVRQDGGTLHLGLQPGVYRSTHLSASVTMPALEIVDISGASRATLQGFDQRGPKLNVTLSGASQVSGPIQCGALAVDMSGASRASLSGGAQSARVQASGASNADLAGLAADQATVTLSGGSSAKLAVNTRLDYDLSGASSLTYTGSPSLGAKNTSGASSVTHR